MSLGHRFLQAGAACALVAAIASMGCNNGDSGGSAGQAGSPTGGAGGMNTGGTAGMGTGGTGGMATGGAGGTGGGQMLDGWSRRFGDDSPQYVWGLAADSQGNVAVVGTMGGKVEMDGVTLETPTEINPETNMPEHVGNDAYVAKLDPSGHVLWGKHFGNKGLVQGYDVAFDQSGNVIITGGFSGTVDFGGGPFTVNNLDDDMFMVKLDSSGNYMWSKQLGGEGLAPQFPGSKLLTDASGDIYVSGQYTGVIDFGGGALSTGPNQALDVFVAKLDASGNHLWSRRFGDDSAMQGVGQTLSTMALDNAGNLLLGGSIRGTVDFGGGPLTTPDGAYLVKLDSQGNHVWSKAFGKYAANVLSIAVTQQNDIVASGYFNDLIDLGGGELNEASGDQFFVKLNSAGEHVWSKQYKGYFFAVEAATSPANTLTFAGYTTDSLDLSALGGPVLKSFSQKNNAALITLGADGSFLEAKNYSAPTASIDPQSEIRAVAFDPQGYLLVGGDFSADIDMGFGDLTAAQGYELPDALVAKIPASL